MTAEQWGIVIEESKMIALVERKKSLELNMKFNNPFASFWPQELG